MHIIMRSWLAMTCGFMLFHVTIRKRKISGSDIIKLTQLEINRTAIKEKIVEAALSVLPIAVIVLGFFSSGGSAVVDISAASYEALYSLIILIDIDSCMRQQFFY